MTNEKKRKSFHKGMRVLQTYLQSDKTPTHKSRACSGGTEEKKTKTTDGIIKNKKNCSCTPNVDMRNRTIIVRDWACCSRQHKAIRAALENMYTQWQGMLIKQTVCPNIFELFIRFHDGWSIFFIISF